MYMGEADDPPTLAGQNPPYGADLTYYLDKSPSAGTKAQIRIVDSGDEVIRTLTGTTNRGINRVWWDLRYDSSKVPRLLTKPSGATWFRMGADGTRDFPVEAKLAPTVAPGDYTVELNVGTTRVSRPLVVLKDPHSSATQQQIAAQTKMGLELRDLADTMSSIIDEAESARAQILGLEAVLKTENRWKSVESEAEALDSKLLSIEEAFLPGHDRGIR